MQLPPFLPRNVPVGILLINTYTEINEERKKKPICLFMESLVDVANVLFHVRKKKGSLRSSLRRRSYRNRVDLLNSSNEILFYKVINVSDKLIKNAAFLAKADVNVNVKTVWKLLSFENGRDDDQDVNCNMININELQSLLPIRPGCRKSILRSVKHVCIALFRKNKDHTSYLMHRIISSGATWEINQECLDDLNQV